MRLDEIGERYALERDVQEGTAKWMRYVFGRFSTWLGRSASMDDVDDERVNAWIAALLSEGLARRTVRSYRGAMVMAWRYAVEIGVCDRPPARLRRIKVSPLVPCGWTKPQVESLLREAMSMGGFYRCGVRRSSFWVAVIIVIWESGLRVGDLRRLRRSHFDSSGACCLAQHKTGWPIVFRLSAHAVSAVREIARADEDEIFRGVVSKKWFFVTFKRLARAAGLSGGTKKIRKSGATAVEAASPGGAMLYLGHRTPGLAYQYYVDPRLIQQTRPTPPPLELPPEREAGA